MSRGLRTIVIGLTLAVASGLASADGASAHVHVITPLLRCGGDLSVTGGNRTDSTPASATNGGPITGLIPSSVGKASLGFGDGGFTAVARCNGS